MRERTQKPARAAPHKAVTNRHKRGRGPDPETVEAIFARLAALNPEPATELAHDNVFTLLVAVVLSAQATDAGVNRATKTLFPRADTPARMLALGEDALREAIKTIGLYRNKAKNVIALSQALIEHHDGEVPHDREALEALPGVGRKTANVVLNVAFGEETIAVDTHIFRIANRLGLAPGRTPLEVEQGLERVVPARYRLHAHHWLILHGRYICVARAPKCWICPIADLCPFEPKTAGPKASGPKSLAPRFAKPKALKPEPSDAKAARAKPSRAKPSRAKPSRAKPSRAKAARAKAARAKAARAKAARAKPSSGKTPVKAP
jgi:endonuclease-3